VTAGVVVGLLIGFVYVASLRHNLSRAVTFPVKHGVRLVQYGSLARLLFAWAALSLAARLFPGVDPVWALGAAFAAALVMLVRIVRRGVQA
jgi:hypothetical protein